MESIHQGHRQRLKERFRKEGLEHFSDIQVLELLLFYSVPRRDTNPLAHELLDTFGSLRGVLEANPDDLASVKGMGEGSAQLLALIPQLLKRYLASTQGKEEILDTTMACGRYLVPHFFLAREELVYLLCLDAKCKLLDCRMLQSGTVNNVGISVRKIMEVALRMGATSVILAHNHTSGIALPSQEDRDTTRRLWTALNAAGITLADHIIVAGDDFVSMQADGFFDSLR
mgnify:CR=1 FL=1